jgi:hypothetical protein
VSGGLRPTVTPAGLVGSGLGRAGVGAVYGAPFPGLAVVAVRDLSVAALLAMAHERVHGEPAAVHRGAGSFVVAPAAVGPSGGADRPGGDDGRRLRLDDPAGAAGLFADLADLLGDGTPHPVTLDVGLDRDPPADRLVRPPPAAPDGAPPGRWLRPPDAALDALRSATRPVVVAGPGVLRRGATPGLHALAAAANLGVLNTWGAKGVIDWRSRHHWATAGLQQRDLELGGLGGTDGWRAADVVLATGLAPDETPGDLASFAPVVTIDPRALGALAGSWWRPAGPLGVPPLRAGLAGATEWGWARTARPLAPSQVTRNYGVLTAGRGVVAADPGVAGFWVARTFPTTVAGEAVVPGRTGPTGFAVACAIVARLRRPGRAALAAFDAPRADVVGALLDAAAGLGVPVVAEEWASDGPPLDAAAHLERLTAAMWSPDPVSLVVATDPGQWPLMEEVAGPVVAWPHHGAVAA